ncbi:TMEM165/GDT1 family protein [Sphingomonas sp. M1-B02]|uniref:TMEM165/GDT1 family protein n=1 Tax=Sphingomonas sp. M1-B02 TaxID=3114300 RepID=UPI00223FB2F8|nr:TMEM165/GDT1 family protein [Sphingomonas sp. S6-11]UZK65501.1 TMEM165/GDT1 family protein [Sphingomonas sp. S6-11]
MEAIVPAFLLALLSQLGDRPALLTAILADRYRRPLVVACAAGLAHALGNGLAALAGVAMAPILNPNAQALLLAFALLAGGLGGFLNEKRPSRYESWKLGAFFAPLLGIFVLALGDRTQFFTLAVAAKGMPWYAAVGAAIAAFAVGFVAALLGEAGWRALPLRWVRIVSAALFLVAGIYIGLGALRLL